MRRQEVTKVATRSDEKAGSDDIRQEVKNEGVGRIHIYGALVYFGKYTCKQYWYQMEKLDFSKR